MYFIFSLLLIGCGGADDETGQHLPTSTVSHSTTDDGGCDEVVLNYDGEDKPQVGDMWTVWLKCDGALLMGPSVIATDPQEFAQINNNEVTFLMAGTGDLTVQTGSFSDTITVIVGQE